MATIESLREKERRSRGSQKTGLSDLMMPNRYMSYWENKMQIKREQAREESEKKK